MVLVVVCVLRMFMFLAVILDSASSPYVSKDCSWRLKSKPRASLAYAVHIHLVWDLFLGKALSYLFDSPSSFVLPTCCSRTRAILPLITVFGLYLFLIS